MERLRGSNCGQTIPTICFDFYILESEVINRIAILKLFIIALRLMIIPKDL